MTREEHEFIHQVLVDYLLEKGFTLTTLPDGYHPLDQTVLSCRFFRNTAFLGGPSWCDCSRCQSHWWSIQSTLALVEAELIKAINEPKPWRMPIKVTITANVTTQLCPSFVMWGGTDD